MWQSLTQDPGLQEKERQTYPEQNIAKPAAAAVTG